MDEDATSYEEEHYLVRPYFDVERAIAACRQDRKCHQDDYLSCAREWTVPILSRPQLSTLRRSLDAKTPRLAIVHAITTKLIETAIHERVPPNLLASAVTKIEVEHQPDYRRLADHWCYGFTWWYGRRLMGSSLVDEHDMRLGNLKSPLAAARDTADSMLGTLRGHMSTRAELHHFRLNQHFPKRIRDVQVEMNLEISEPMIIVNFVNGHTVRRRECEVMTKDFLALCGMLYDLPPKGQ